MFAGILLVSHGYFNTYSNPFTSLFSYQIGNPLLRLDQDVSATYEFFWSHGMISDEIGLTIMSDCDFDDYVSGTSHNVTNSCIEAITEANKIVGDYINNYDVILDVCYPAIVEQELRLRKMVYIMFFSHCFDAILLLNLCNLQ